MHTEKTFRLTILHTNDLHGHVAQLTRIAAVVREIRHELELAGGYCLYLDAGDSEDTTQLESCLTKGSSMNAMLRAAGCDYAALGNAIPIRYGPQAIADLAVHFGRPLICANYLDGNDALVEGLVPFIIHDFGPFKLGIIGLTDPMKTYETVFRLRPQKPDAVLPGLIRKARQAGAQTMLLLSHLSLKQDLVLAENGAGLDVIIGGHSHDTLTTPLVENGTIIAQAGDFGRFLGRLDLEIDAVSGKVIDHQGTLIPINEDISPDPAATSVVESERKRVHAIMGRVIGSLNARVELADDRECIAGNLLADALLERMQGTGIALVLTGHWETGLEPGQLTQGELFSAVRSAANPAKVMLSGGQILQFLRAALTPGNAAKTHRSLRGRKIGYPHFAGMTLDVDPLNLDKIEVRIAGELLTEEGIYPVATTDMEISDWINYLPIPDEQVEYEVPTVMPEVLEDYIKAHTPLSPPSTGRLKTLTG